eukprot:scaffold7767_cov86-Skeletonema_dohrnii-CCMP3373.AAC.1
MMLQGSPRLSTLSLAPAGMYSTLIKADLVPLAESRLAVAVHILPVDLITEKESRGEEERCVIPTTMNRLTPTYYQQNNTSPFVFPPSVELVSNQSRGAWFNQHPGNENFRKMIDEKKAVYMAGTKKQKMNMSNVIVEAIYSMKPPGRFLKKCPDTGQWNELSTRDAADRVAQAMAYAVRGKDKSKRRREERRRSLRSSRQKSKNEGDDDVVRKSSSQSAHRSTHLQQRAIADQLRDNASSSSSAHHGLDTRRGGAVGTSNDMPCASDLLH